MNCLLTRNDESWLRHRRLAHIHMPNLNRIALKKLVIGLPKLKFERDKLCEACQKGKQKKKHFQTLKCYFYFKTTWAASHGFIQAL